MLLTVHGRKHAGPVLVLFESRQYMERSIKHFDTASCMWGSILAVRFDGLIEAFVEAFRVDRWMNGWRDGGMEDG